MPLRGWRGLDIIGSGGGTTEVPEPEQRLVLILSISPLQKRKVPLI